MKQTDYIKLRKAQARINTASTEKQLDGAKRQFDRILARIKGKS